MTIMNKLSIEKIEANRMDTDSEISDRDEADDEVSDEHSVEENESCEVFNSGWVGSISQILKSNKPKKKKCLVLSRAKKLTVGKKSNPKSEVGFEIQQKNGEIKDEKNEVTAEQNLEEIPKKRRRELPNLRVKPNILEKDRERTLQKIATKGVVQLFNAVKMQQKDINKKLQEAGPLEVRKERVLKNIDKRTFLDVLMGEKSQKVGTEIDLTKKESTSDSTWNVLKDDFMMGAKMKDWDKELETEEIQDEIIESE